MNLLDYGLECISYISDSVSTTCLVTTLQSERHQKSITYALYMVCAGNQMFPGTPHAHNVKVRAHVIYIDCLAAGVIL